jgi:hypothetical protein
MAVRAQGALSADSQAGQGPLLAVGEWDLVIPAIIRDRVRE